MLSYYKNDHAASMIQRMLQISEYDIMQQYIQIQCIMDESGEVGCIRENLLKFKYKKEVYNQCESKMKYNIHSEERILRDFKNLNVHVSIKYLIYISKNVI